MEQASGDHRNTNHGRMILAALALLGPGLYVVGLVTAATIDGLPWTAVTCFDPALSQHIVPQRAAAAIAMALGAVVLLWVIPWLLGTVALAKAAGTCRVSAAFSAHVWSLVANTAALFVTGLVLRATVGIDRTSFLAAWGAWIGVLLVLAGRPASVADQLAGMARRRGILTAVALGTVLLGTVVFFPEHFLQCFNGDGTEFDELARSLRHHSLPYWEIEPTGQFGTFVANPTVTNSYWTLGLHVLLGPGELATRLPYWVWWLGVMLVAGRQIRNPPMVYFPLALLVLLVSVWYTFYVGYDPYAADLANPGVPDALFTLLVLLGLDCLRREDPWGWAAAMVAASLLFYAGVVMLGLSAAAAMVWRPVPRGAMFRAALAATAILSGIAILYLVLGWHNGSLAAWGECLRMEWVDKYFAPEPRGQSGLLFLGYFVLGCGGLPVVCLLAAFGRGPWQRTVATVVVAYLAIILGSGLKNLHYLGPLLPLPLVLWLDVNSSVLLSLRERDISRSERSTLVGRRCAWPTLLIFSIAACLWLCWPVERPLFTLNRMLGQRTTFESGSYEDACRMGEVSEQLYDEGRLGWQIGRHTWVGYATIAGQNASAPLIVSRQRPEGDWQLLATSPEGYGVYCRDLQLLDWLQQHPREAKDRFARVFRPIAPKVKPLADSQDR